MNFTKIVILIFLIFKSSVGFGFISQFSNCCEDKTEISSHENEEDNKDCCNGSSCDCLCCSHVFLDGEKNEIFLSNFDVLSLKPIEQFSFYHHLNPALIWHPPRQV